MKLSIQTKVTRRQFLLMSAATATVAAASDKLFGGTNGFWLKNAEAAKAPAQEVVLRGECGMCMFADCVNQVHMVNGVVVGIEGEPTSPTNQGRLCGRGLSAIQNLYNPYRVKAPMKRTNPEKGTGVDPKWVEISWDEALATVGQQLKTVRQQDPRGLMLNSGFGQRETVLRTAFMQATGSPNSVSSNGPLCAVHYSTCLVQHSMPVALADFGFANYHISIGRSIGPNHGNANGSVIRTADAVSRGMKLIVVDPRASQDAAFGEWVPIRPGTDLAFTLGMINVIMHELGTYDVGFLKNRSNAPYLIGPEGNYVVDAASKKPLIWDAADSKAKTFDDQSLKDPALEGKFSVGGVSAQPGFQIVKERVKEYTPEWAQKISTVPAETIRRIAKDFVAAAQIGSTVNVDGFTFPLRPASIVAERGSIGHTNGTYLDLSTKILNMLIGNMEVPGGNLGTSIGPALEPGADGIVKPTAEALFAPWKFPPEHVDMNEFYPHRHTTPHLAYGAIDDPQSYYLPYKVQVLFDFGGNSIRSTAAPDLITRAIKKIPFSFQISYHFDQMAELADILLPEHSVLERTRVGSYGLDNQNVDLNTLSLRIVYGRDPVPPLYNTRNGDQILIDLAEQGGFLFGQGGLNGVYNASLGKNFQLDVNKRYSLEEILDARVKTLLGEKSGLKELNATGFVNQPVSPKQGYNYFYFPGNKTRHPFYFVSLKTDADALKANLEKAKVTVPKRDLGKLLAHYEPVPHWIANQDFDSTEYDLFAANWKVPFMMFGLGAMMENPWADEIIEKTNPYVRAILMNSATAARKGLKDGDDIWVESRAGKIRGAVHVTELVHPDVVGIPGCYGAATNLMNPIAKKGPHYNVLISTDDNSVDPISGGLDISPRVKVRKA